MGVDSISGHPLRHFDFFAVYRFAAVQKLTGLVMGILAPFIYGLVMAYLLCPVYNFTVRNVYGMLTRGGRKFPKALSAAKGVGTVVALAVLLTVVTGVLWMIIPGLIDSIVKIIRCLAGEYEPADGMGRYEAAEFPGGTVADRQLDQSFYRKCDPVRYRKGTSGIHYDRNQCISRTDRSTECIEKLFYCDHHLCLFPEQQGSVCGTE